MNIENFLARSLSGRSCAALALLGASACSAAQEAPRVQIPVGLAAIGSQSVQTNLGYEIELSEARLALADLRFASLGEGQQAQLRRGWFGPLHDLLVSTAHAHPGHFSDGEVNGELLGQFVVSFRGEEASLGLATLIVGSYESGLFSFGRASQADGLADDDPMLGHTAFFEGWASRGGRATPFVARVDSPEGRQLTGLPFEVEIGSSARASVALELTPTDPYDGDTLFDDIDFEALSADASGVVDLSPGAADVAIADAYNSLRRALLTHNHYGLRYADVGGEEAL